VLPTGPNDRYTRQSRAVLLEPDPDGKVRWLRFAAGWALGEDAQQPDPMACFREGSNGLLRVSFTEGRALWRDLPALVPAPQGDGKAACRPAAVVESAAALHNLMGRSRMHQPLLVAGLASDQAKLLRWRLEQFPLPQALLAVPDRARELHEQVAQAEALYRALRGLCTDLVAGSLPDPTSKDTRSRARERVDKSPFTATFFSAAERELWAVMERFARDQPDEADALWQRTLRAAALRAWDELVGGLGMSLRALSSEARCARRLKRLLRDSLPAAVATTAAAADKTRTQGA
jgi:CRISPR system Cascade subunit CasA